MAEEKAKHGSTPVEEGVNVQVLLRCRPLSDKEMAERTPQVITCNEALREVTLFQSAGAKSMSRTFRFDKVFGCDSTQEKLFKQAITPIVNEVMDGFNCTIFAYGQTGTGKTYTMEGGPRESDDGRKLSAQAGVIPRSIKQIFDIIDGNNVDSTVKVSFLELYNEELTDLMAGGQDDDSKKLRLLEDRSGVVVQGLEEVIVKSAAEIYQVLDRGIAKRRTASTLLNNRSSRSHSIFTVTIHMKEATADGEDVIKIGKLNLVDLAGSENISRSGAKDGRAREAGSINQSLLTLGRVITALVEHSGHIPYRDSKLTRLLRDSLGGRTKTCIIATIAPTVQCSDETVSTLDYAHRAKNIRNRPELNQKISKTTMIKELAAEIERLKVDLVCNREKNGVYLAADRYELGELERVQLRESVKALKAEAEAEEAAKVAAMEALRVAHSAEVETLMASLERKDAEVQDLQDELNRANITIQERVFIGASLRRAEQCLATHAHQLMTELTTCTNDIHGLFQHLDKVLHLQSQDRTVLQGLESMVASRVTSLAAGVEAACSQQASYLAGVTSDLQSFEAATQADLATIAKQVATVTKGISTVQAAASQQLEALAASTTASLVAAHGQTDASIKQAVASGETSTKAATAALNSLVAALQQQTQQLEALTEQQEKATAVLEQGLQAMAASASTSFKDMSGAATRLCQLEESHAQAAQQAVAAFATSFETAFRSQQAQLMEQVSQLISGFAAERCAALHTGVTGISQQLAQQQTTADSEARGMVAAADSGLSKLQSGAGQCSDLLKQCLHSVQVSSRSMAEAAITASSSGQEASKQLLASHSDQSSALASYISANGKTLHSCSNSVTAAASAVAQELSSNAVQLLTAQQAVGSSISQSGAVSLALVSSLQDSTRHAAEQMAGCQHAQAQALSELKAAVSTTVVSQLAQSLQSRDPQDPAAEPPARRVLPVVSPSQIQELMCPAEEVVLQQLRATKKDILRRGGDVRTAAAMLLSPTLVAAAQRGGRQPISPPPDMRPMAPVQSSSPEARPYRRRSHNGDTAPVADNLRKSNSSSSNECTAMLTSPCSVVKSVSLSTSQSLQPPSRSRIPGAPFPPATPATKGLNGGVSPMRPSLADCTNAMM
ncbi:hypothetical protein QJQ45_024772 [Haematococcus lacustris]|nr:hypothetical protein QJQ45_024772 [Haematococcus lacustris]